MTTKFLGGSSSDLTNGTANLFIANLSVANLDPSRSLKTNATKTLESSNLDIIDVNNLQAQLDSKLSNPLSNTFNFNNFGGENVNNFEMVQLPNLGASQAGTVRLYISSIDGQLHKVNELGVDTVVGGVAYDQSLNTTDNVLFGRVDSASRFVFTDDFGALIWNASGQYIAEVGTGDIEFKANNSLTLNGGGSVIITDPLTIGSYTLPNNLPSSNQILKSDAVGNITWSEIYNQSLNTTDNVEFNKLTIGSGDKVFTYDPNSGSNLKITKGVFDNSGSGIGEVVLNARGTALAPLPLQAGDRIYQQSFLTNDGVGIRNAGGIELNVVDSYLTPNQGGTEFIIDTLNNGNTVPNAKLKCNINGLVAPAGLVVGDGATNYTMPNVRGTNGQILKTNASGVLTFQDETGENYDQSLNTTDDVIFNSVNATTSIQCAGLGIGEFPTANLSIKSLTGQDCEIKLDTTTNQDSILSFKNQGADKWDIRNQAPDDDLVIADRFGDAIIKIKNADNSIEITEDGVSNGLLICDSINTQTIVNGSNTLINIGASETTFETDIVSSTGNKIYLNGNDNPPLLVANPVVINLPSAGVFGAGLMLKIVNVGGNAQVTPILPGDGDAIPTIGVSLNAPNAVNSICEVAIGGTFEAVVQNLISVVPGDLCEKSDVVGQTGRVAPAVASVGSVLVALTTATGNVAGTNKALFMFKKSESF